MLKYYSSVLYKVILLNLACSLFFSLLTNAANEGKEYNSDEHDQIYEPNTSTSSENHVRASGSGKPRSGPRRADSPTYLSLKLSAFKISLIEQKENELRNNYGHSAVFPWKTGHHWNLSDLSDTETLNLCYTLWSGLTFSDIEEIDETDLPSKLYPYCNKSKKVPLKDINNSGKPIFWYNISYPLIDTVPHRHGIAVLQCFCRFTIEPKNRFTKNNSNRYFFAHKFNDNEYLVLSPASKEHYKVLRIIDVQEVDPFTVHLGDKMSIPTFTGKQGGAVDQSSSTNNETEGIPSGFQSHGRIERADRPMHLSLTVSRRKTDLIIQKEYEMKNNFNDSAAFPKQSGHRWNFFDLSENKARNLCYSLWLGFKFSEIDEIDKTEVPPQVYPHCKSKKVPIGDLREFGPPSITYNIVYPHAEEVMVTKHRIDVLECICKFTRLPKGSHISSKSNRKFFAYCFKRDEYLVLSPISKEQYKLRDLRIIDVQKVNPTLLHFGDKTIVPVSTN